jgi:hypothetical protein
MIEFKKLTLEDKQRIDELLKISDYQSCEYTFSNLFIWRNHYNTHFAIIEDCVVFRIEEQGEVSYSYPAGGGNKKAVIEKLIESFGKELTLVWITDSNLFDVRGKRDAIFAQQHRSHSQKRSLVYAVARPSRDSQEIRRAFDALSAYVMII